MTAAATTAVARDGRSDGVGTGDGSGGDGGGEEEEWWVGPTLVEAEKAKVRV